MDNTRSKKLEKVKQMFIEYGFQFRSGNEKSVVVRSFFPVGVYEL